MNNGLLGFPRGTGAGVAGSAVAAPLIFSQTTAYIIPEDGWYYLKAQGPGGGGGRGNPAGPGGGGGSAGSCEEGFAYLRSGDIVNITVGAFGVGATTNNTNGTNGGNTVVLVSGKIRLRGEGGLGGFANGAFQNGGRRQSNSSLPFIHPAYYDGGASGAGGLAGANPGSAGTGAGNAWSQTNDGSAAGGATNGSQPGGGGGGDSANGFGGRGGDGSATAGQAGQDGSGYGGGGGGGGGGGTSTGNGGNGAPGCGYVQRIA